VSTTTALIGLLRASLRTRQRLVVENLALRPQPTVLKRSIKRPRIDDSDRIFWVLMRRTFREWKDCLHFVKPDTVVKWHRRGIKYDWARKSKPHQHGRPPISWKLVHIIRRLSVENVTWGAPRIQDELALLGHEVAESTIDKYRVRHRSPELGQRWSTFLRNHMPTTIACDFFTVPCLQTRPRRKGFVGQDLRSPTMAA
jgi:putative transposase